MNLNLNGNLFFYLQSIFLNSSCANVIYTNGNTRFHVFYLKYLKKLSNFFDKKKLKFNPMQGVDFNMY